MQRCFYFTELSPRWKTHSSQFSSGLPTDLSLQAANIKPIAKGRVSSSAQGRLWDFWVTDILKNFMKASSLLPS